MPTPPKNQYAESGAITQWVADVTGRRVPLFVMHSTGLKTKTEVIAKYGYGAVFKLTKDGVCVLKKKGKLPA